MEADEEMGLTSLLLCETCVKRVKRCCAVQDAAEIKESKL